MTSYAAVRCGWPGLGDGRATLREYDPVVWLSVGYPPAIALEGALSGS
jgi:hypothetical protein